MDMDELKQFLTPRLIRDLIFGVWCIWMLAMYRRQKHPVLSLLVGSASGIIGLFLWHHYGTFLGYQPPLTLGTISLSAIGGIPALLLLWGIRLLVVTK